MVQFGALYGRREEVHPFVLHIETFHSNKLFPSYKQNGLGYKNPMVYNRFVKCIKYKFICLE